MKKFTKALFALSLLLCFFAVPSFAYQYITDFSNYQNTSGTIACYGPSNNCQACHTVGGSASSIIFNSGTTWHSNHYTYAAYVCAVCHTGPENGCSHDAVETINCKTCHNLNPSFEQITPVELPCDWVLNHDLADPSRGTNCLSCHTICAPTVIELASFTATPKEGKVILQWNTGSEVDNTGFNIYRAESENGQYSKINYSLITSKGTSTLSASYEFIDTDVQNRKAYYYKLEDIDLNGNATMHGPVSATPRLIWGIFGK
jgi:hypothetical protein